MLNATSCVTDPDGDTLSWRLQLPFNSSTDYSWLTQDPYTSVISGTIPAAGNYAGNTSATDPYGLSAFVMLNITGIPVITAQPSLAFTYSPSSVNPPSEPFIGSNTPSQRPSYSPIMQTNNPTNGFSSYAPSNSESPTISPSTNPVQLTYSPTIIQSSLVPTADVSILHPTSGSSTGKPHANPSFRPTGIPSENIAIPSYNPSGSPFLTYSPSNNLSAHPSSGTNPNSSDVISFIRKNDIALGVGLGTFILVLLALCNRNKIANAFRSTFGWTQAATEEPANSNIEIAEIGSVEEGSSPNNDNLEQNYSVRGFKPGATSPASLVAREGTEYRL